MAMERDEGEYAYAASQILRGGFPYLDFYNMKLPGVYYFYAIVFLIFGKKIAAVRIMVLVLNIIGGFLLVKIGEKWIDKKAGWLAGGFYMLFSLSFHVQGITANCEHFVVVFFLLSLYFLVFQRYFFMGFFAALAVLMKQQGAILLIFSLVYFIYILIKTKEEGFSLKKIALAKIGFLIPLSIFLLSLWYHKAIDAFKFFAVDYAQTYIQIRKPAFDFINLKLLFEEWERFLFDCRISLVFALILGFFHKKSTFKTPLNPLFLVLFVLIGYACVLPGWYFRAHYYQFMVPPVALLMAYLWSWFRSFNQDILFKILYSSALYVGLCFSIHSQKVYLFHEKKESVVNQMYPGLVFNELKELGLILKKNSKPTDTIGFMGHEPQIVFYADRVSASGYMYNYPQLETQPYNRRMAEQYRDEIIKNKPKWFVDCLHWQDWGWFDTRIPMEETYNFIKKNYYLRGVLYQDKKFDWQIDSVDIQREPMAIIFERRDSQQTAPTPLILD
jgi:hypothetical protein